MRKHVSVLEFAIRIGSTHTNLFYFDLHVDRGLADLYTISFMFCTRSTGKPSFVGNIIYLYYNHC